MFGRQESRRLRADRVRRQAWFNLVSAVNSAEASARHARDRAAHAYGEATGRVESSAKEARRRATDALEALAGRRPHRPWGLLTATAVAGVTVGWIAATLGRRKAVRQREMELTELLAGPATQPAGESTGTSSTGTSSTGTASAGTTGMAGSGLSGAAGETTTGTGMP